MLPANIFTCFGDLSLFWVIIVKPYSQTNSAKRLQKQQQKTWYVNYHRSILNNRIKREFLFYLIRLDVYLKMEKWMNKYLFLYFAVKVQQCYILIKTFFFFSRKHTTFALGVGRQMFIIKNWQCFAKKHIKYFDS